MGILDFLFEGRPPPSVTTYGQAVQNLPAYISDYTQGLIAKANAVAAEPYQPYGGPRIAGFTGDQNAARNFTRDIAGNYVPAVNDALSRTGSATGMGALQAANPLFTEGADFARSSANPAMGGLAMAAPYIARAGENFPDAAGRYMNPYIDAVTNRSAQLAKRTFDEQISPNVEAQFVRAGQRGSTAQLKELGKQTRDLTEGLQSQTNAQLADAYNQSNQMFQADQSRQGSLAQLVGQLTEQGRSNELGAGQLISGIGTSRGNLGINATQQDLASAQQMGALAQLAQALGYKDAGALDQIGTQEQNLNQRNLDLAYDDFQRQRDFPRQNVDWLSAIIRGLPTPTTTTTTQTGPANSYQPSGLAQLGSIATGIGGLLDVLKGGG
jgi:hypothetical protein